jgi:hypothetical protein
VAPPRQLSVPDPSARHATESRLPRAWGAPDGPPLGRAMSLFTIDFERQAADGLCACDVDRARQLLHTSWDETWHLIERAVVRGQVLNAVSVPAPIGVDERSASMLSLCLAQPAYLPRNAHPPTRP